MSAFCITFKTKPFPIIDGDRERMAINFKKTLGRADVNMRPSDHRYFNSDLFPGMLNRVYRRIIGEYKQWAFLDNLPAGVTVDTSKFLAVVTIQLPEDFK